MPVQGPPPNVPGLNVEQRKIGRNLVWVYVNEYENEHGEMVEQMVSRKDVAAGRVVPGRKYVKDHGPADRARVAAPRVNKSYMLSLAREAGFKSIDKGASLRLINFDKNINRSILLALRRARPDLQRVQAGHVDFILNQMGPHLQQFQLQGVPKGYRRGGKKKKTPMMPYGPFGGYTAAWQPGEDAWR